MVFVRPTIAKPIVMGRHIQLNFMQLTAEEQVKENVRVLQESSLNEYKRSAKMTALNSAINLRPYISDAALVSSPDPEFDVIKKADEIYKWLLEI